MSTLNPYFNEEANECCSDANFVHLNKIPNKAIVICDQQGVIIAANIDFCELIKFEIVEIVGKKMESTLFSKIGFLKEINSLNNLLNGKSKECEFQFFKEDGTNKIIEIRAEMVRDKSIGYFFKDITKQRNLQTELQALTKKLEKLNEDKSRFISVLAHDLKSPFNSILGFVALLKENFRESSLDDIEKYITYIDGASKNTYNLLEDTLEWIRSETGKLNIEKDSYNINNLILDVLKNYHPIAKAKNINIRFDNEHDVIVFCDANMIKSVFRNLLSNAIKFTNKNGEINITITVDTNKTKISITDNGIGISEDSQVKLFDIKEFYSTNGTAHEKGTGMGLVLCKEFIDKHNGTLSLISKVGVGSTFAFTIPKL